MSAADNTLAPADENSMIDMNMSAADNMSMDSATDLSMNDAATDNVAATAEPAPPPNPWCDIIEARAPADDCTRYAKAVQGLRQGLAAFNPPKTMKQGETRHVQLAVSRDPQHAPPGSMIPGTPDSKIALPVQVGRHMAAVLTGDGIRVVAKSPEQQDLFLSASAVWTWAITAEAAPEHHLELTVYVQIPDEAGNLKPAWTKASSYDVTVAVSFWERSRLISAEITNWLKDGAHLLKALTALVIAAGALWLALTKLMKKRRRSRS